MTSKRILRGAEKNRVVEAILDNVNHDAFHLSTISHVKRGIEGMTRGIPFTWEPVHHRQFPRADLIQIGDLVGQIAVVELWKRNGRVALDLNEYLAADLTRSTMGKMPGDLFDHLPYINPMVVLPQPWPVKNPDKGGYAGEITAFFITGYTGDAFCTTTDESRDGIAVMFWMSMYRPGSTEPEKQAGVIIYLPTFQDTFTLADVVRFTEHQHGAADRDMDIPTSTKILKQFVPAALNILVYLCCDNRDVEKPVLRQHKGKRTQAPARKPFWVRVGWHMGPALHEARRRYAGRTKDGVSIPSGAEYGPQHRTGHFKAVWFGPAKKQSTTRWIAPYWTKLDMLAEGETPPTMIVPVGPQRHDPLRRRHNKRRRST